MRCTIAQGDSHQGLSMYLSIPKRKGAVRTADFPPSSSIGSALAPLPSVWGCDIFDSWQWPRLCDYGYRSRGIPVKSAGRSMASCINSTAAGAGRDACQVVVNPRTAFGAMHCRPFSTPLTPKKTYAGLSRDCVFSGDSV
jgi:hypothetical protein